MALDKKTLEELEKKLKEIDKLAKALGEDIDSVDLKPIEQNAGIINLLFKSLKDRYDALEDPSDYLVSSFQRLLGEVKNSSTGISQATKALKGLSSIAEELANYQRNYSQLSVKDIEKLQTKAVIETNRLTTARRILETEEADLRAQRQSPDFLNKSVKEQNAINNQLAKNIAAQENINNLLSLNDVSLKDLNNQLDQAAKKAKTIQDIYGLSGAAIDGLSKALDKLGFGGLSAQLGIDEAKTKMSQLAREIAEGPEKAKASQERLNLLTKELEVIKNSEVTKNKEISSITSKISNLNTKNLSEKQILAGFGGKELKNLQLQLNLERESLNDLQTKNKSKTKAVQDNIKAESEELRILQEFNNTHEGINGKLAVFKTGISSMGASLMKNLRDPLAVVGFLVTQMVDALKSADKSTGDLAKDFNLTYDQAASVRNELIQMGNLSGNVALNARALQESMVAVGKSLGSNAMLNKEDLTTFTELREMAGYTNDELVGMQKLTLATGGNLKDNTKQFLGTVTALNAQNKLTVNAKQLLKEVANTSAAIKLSIGGTTDKLAEAAFKAKQFGINLEQADKMSEQLLDFESSINNQISAELITGKALNLDKARLLALNGDIAGASAEILKQVGGTAEFTKMNRIQQEALAKAVGLSREELAKSLIEREALAKIGAKDAASAKEKFDSLVAQYGYEKATTMLGDEQYANQLRQQSVQERFNQSIEKLKEIFISLAEPILQIISPFVNLATTILPLVNVALSPILFVVRAIGEGISYITNSVTGLIGALTGANTQLSGMQAFVGSIAAAYLAYKGYVIATNVYLGISAALSQDKALAENASRIAIIAQRVAAAAYLPIQIALALISGTKTIADVTSAEALTLGLATAAIVGGLAMVVGAMSSAKSSVKDGIIGPDGGLVVSGRKGTYQLDKNDTVIAGTELGSKVADAKISPKGELEKSADKGTFKNVSPSPTINVVLPKTSMPTETAKTNASVVSSEISKQLVNRTNQIQSEISKTNSLTTKSLADKTNQVKSDISKTNSTVSKQLSDKTNQTKSKISLTNSIITKQLSDRTSQTQSEISKTNKSVNVAVTDRLDQVKSELSKSTTTVADATSTRISRAFVTSIPAKISTPVATATPVKTTVSAIGPTPEISRENIRTAETRKITEKQTMSAADIANMVNELKSIKSEISAQSRIHAENGKKPIIIENSMNGTKFGTAVAMNVHKTQ